jgi:hypothetical protein
MALSAVLILLPFIDTKTTMKFSRDYLIQADERPLQQIE